MTLADYFEADFAAAKSGHQQEQILRAWKRACEESLFERSLTNQRYPHNRSSNNRYKIERWLPHWIAVDDDAILDALELVNQRVAEVFR